MKGRGVRVIDLDALKSVTPDADAKTHFVIVDAVGVAEQEKTCTKPLDRQPPCRSTRSSGRSPPAPRVPTSCPRSRPGSPGWIGN